MATASFGGTNYTLKSSPVIGTWPIASECNDRVYCMADECFSTSTAGAGSHFYCGGLPRGANVLSSVVWPIDTATYGEGDNHAAASTGQLGLLVEITEKGDTVTADPDLFGDITDLNATATPQVIEPVPDGTIYTSTLDMAMRRPAVPVMLSAANNIVSTEGIALKMLYTMGGRT